MKESRIDEKKLLKLARNLIGSNTNVDLPHLTSAELRADKFNNFFTRKTTIIRKFPNNSSNIYTDVDIMFNGEMF